MTPGTIFIDWIEHLHGQNGLLASYPEFIADNVFLSNLCGQISKPLQDAIYNIPEIRECNNLNAWTKLVMVQDDKLHCKCKELEDVVEATMAAQNKCVHVAEAAPATSTLTTTTTTTSNSSYHPPPQCCTNSAPPAGSSLNTPYPYRYQSCLEPNEHVTLAANEDCFACRDIVISKAKQDYMKYKGCPPPAEGYKHHTPELVIRCYADKAKGIPLFTITVIANNITAAPAPVPAAAVQVLTTTAWPIAAVVSANETGILNAANADGTEADANLSINSDAVSKRSSVLFTVPHLLWNCMIDDYNPSASNACANVTALVDDSAHLILIHPQLVDYLNLKRCLLPEPIDIGIAISDSPSPACRLTEWVKLKPHNISNT